MYNLLIDNLSSQPVCIHESSFVSSVVISSLYARSCPPDGGRTFASPGSPAHPHPAVAVGDCQPVGGTEGSVPWGDSRAGRRAHLPQHSQDRAGWRGLQGHAAQGLAGAGGGPEGGLQTQEVSFCFQKNQSYHLLYFLFLFDHFLPTCLTFLRYSRDYVVEGEPYAGYDRHNAEVAAFHLDRCVNIAVWASANCIRIN